MAGPGEAGSAPAIEIVTSANRPDLDDEARAAFRPGWPEFIFHDQVAHEYIGRVGDYFPQYDILVLDHGEVVAGGWGYRSSGTARSPRSPRDMTAAWPAR
jgi:hypothetical protein